ncbi:transketolase [Patescibacteria group bacterium]|nr:transketolase [Patescibacteria group bacterium]
MKIEELQDKANEIREIIIKMLAGAGSGHSAGALGSADFWTALYFGGVINYRSDEPEWEDRDRVVLSAGHYCPVLYAVLAEAGFFLKEELDSLRKIDSRLQGHPHKSSTSEVEQLPGVENTSGPLGQGVSVAVGMAMAAKMDKKDWRVICFMGDGEQNEGQVWEAYLNAAKFDLGNLTLVIDRNNIQLSGRTETIMPLEPFKAKLESFGLRVIEVNGHDIEEILQAMKMARVMLDRPTAIILYTTPGKGVDFMENKSEWHGKPPIEPGEAVEALEEINSIKTYE